MASLPFVHIASLLMDAAGPLLGGRGPSKKQIDQSVQQADGQAAVAPGADRAAPAESAPAPIATSASTSQIVRLAAEPPLEWDRNAEAWTCPSATTLVVTFADGGERSFQYDAGTVIAIAAGMIHFPPCAQHS